MIKRVGSFVFALTLLFSFAVPVSAAVPSGYTELEYIESSGTQYIDTGYNPNNNTRVVVDASLIGSSSDPTLFGCYDGSNGTALIYVSTNGMQSIVPYYAKTNTTISFDASGRHIVDFNKNVLSIDNSIVHTFSSLSYSCSCPLYLSCFNNSGTVTNISSVRFYSCQIYDDGILVRDFIPVKDSSGSIGLWDDVGETFYSNSGTGSFVAGPVVDDGTGDDDSGDDVPVSPGNPFGVPVGYTSYEYLQSDGSSYIETDFYPNERTGFSIDFQMISDTSSPNEYVMGSWSGSTVSDKFQFYVSFDSSALNSTVGIGGIASVFTLTDLYSRHTVSYSGDGIITFDNSSKEIDVTPFQSAYDPFVFCQNLSGSSTGLSYVRLYGFSMTDSGVLVRDFIPVSNEFGDYGLWDKVNNKFYGNLGSGSFSVGAVTGTGAPEGDSVADVITDLNTQIHDIESVIYEDLHTYSAQVDPSTATNFSGNFLSAMSFISDTWTSAYNQLGDMQVIVTFPLFLAIAMLFIGRMNSVIASGAMKSRKNNDKKGGGDVG